MGNDSMPRGGSFTWVRVCHLQQAVWSKFPYVAGPTERIKWKAGLFWAGSLGRHTWVDITLQMAGAGQVWQVRWVEEIWKKEDELLHKQLLFSLFQVIETQIHLPQTDANFTWKNMERRRKKKSKET